MIPVQTYFLYRFSIGGYGLGASLAFSLQKQMKAGTSGPKPLLPWSRI